MTLNGRSRISGANEGSDQPEGRYKPKFVQPDPIKKAGEEIVASYRQIESAWKKAEAKLSLAHVPFDVKIKVGSGFIGDDISPIGEYVTYLGYMKIRNEWRICLVKEGSIFDSQGREDEYDCKPITECAVQDRLDMFEWFSKLYAEVIKVTTDFVPVIKDKVAKFECELDLIDL